MTTSQDPKLKRSLIRVVIAMLTLFGAGLVCFIVGMLLDQRDRVALPGLCLSIAALAGGAAYGLVLLKRIWVVKSYWRSEWEWRDMDEAPFRYWLDLVSWSMLSAFFVIFAVLSFLGHGLKPLQRPEWSGPTELKVLVIMLAPLALSYACAVMALRNLRPGSTYRVGKLLLPRHVTANGRYWLWASYLFSLVFIVFVMLSPLISEWMG